MNNPIPKKQLRIFSIDLLKSSSILFVVAYWHLFDYTNALPNYQNTITNQLVLIVLGIFSLVSGYLIGSKDIKLNLKAILTFYQSRLIRIYPLYLLAIGLFMALKLIKDFSLALKSILLLSVIIRPAPITLWFISMLILFYLIAPFLVYLRKNSFHYLLFCVSLFLLMSLYGQLFQRLEPRFLLYFPTFAIGVFLAGYQQKIQRINWIKLASLFVFLWILSTSIQEEIVFFYIKPIKILLISIGALLTFVLTLKMDSKLTTLFSPCLKFIELISYSSFCMYLFHRPVFQTLISFYFPSNELFQALYLLGIGVPLVILFSWLLQKSYDQLLVKILKPIKNT